MTEDQETNHSSNEAEEEKQLRTRHVFIDTSVFKGLNYSFRSKRFQTLTALAREKKAFIHLTDITVREVQSNIAEDILEVHRAFKKFREDSKIRILKNLDKDSVRALFTDFDMVEAEGELLNQFKAFRDDCLVDIIPMTQVSIDGVFEKYFALTPPFSTGKKKHEFPDAFVLAALARWCQEKVAEIYVITGDDDMKSACEQSGPLLALGKVDEFLDLVTSHDETLAALINQLFEQNRPKIVEEIKRSFCFLDSGLRMRTEMSMTLRSRVSPFPKDSLSKLTTTLPSTNSPLKWSFLPTCRLKTWIQPHTTVKIRF